MLSSKKYGLLEGIYLFFIGISILIVLVIATSIIEKSLKSI